MTEPISNSRQAGESSNRRGAWLALFFVAWTVLAGLAAWWLLTYEWSAPAMISTTGGGTAKPWADRMCEWLTLAHVNLHRAYPWLLLAPYAIWLGARFHFDKRQWCWRLPLLLLGGAGFVLAAREFTYRLTPKLPAVVVVSASSSTAYLRVEAPKISVMQGASDDPALRELVQALTNTSFASQVHGGLTTRTVIYTNFNGVRPTVRPEEISSLIASNLIPAVRKQLNAIGVRGPTPLADWSLGLDGLAYVALIGLAHVGLFHRRYREREQQAALLENRLNQVRLHTLQAQLQPLFLFNALNGIATLVRRDPAAAEEMLTSLSDLLRLALGQSDRQEIPLREEMEFLNRYLEIQQMRFRDKLNVEQAIEPAALDCAVPALLLQPLLENAIRHGIEPSPEAGVVRITAARNGARLILSIKDNGVGLVEGNGGNGTGVGLANVRERLAALYPGEHEFQFGERSGRGVAVRISVPWRAVAETKSNEALSPSA